MEWIIPICVILGIGLIIYGYIKNYKDEKKDRITELHR